MNYEWWKERFLITPTEYIGGHLCTSNVVSLFYVFSRNNIAGSWLAVLEQNVKNDWHYYNMNCISHNHLVVFAFFFLFALFDYMHAKSVIYLSRSYMHSLFNLKWWIHFFY
jgi:hypothetical protein